MGWDKFNSIAVWMIKIAYLNILWIVFTILGFVLFGLFPATSSMFTIVHKWFHKEHHLPIFHTFWVNYRSNFLKLNGFSFIFLIIGYILYYDFLFLQLNSGKLQFLFPIFVLISLAYVITLLFFFPVYVQFDLKFFQYIKQSFLVAVTSPLETLQIAIAIAALYFIVTFLPGIIPLFTGSVLAVAMTWISYRAFRKIRLRKGLS
ncbi:YesL family protein [Oceanobacillus longus]|uniref:YesL family protein n=1 Tax=Oceanobacillus longus TaxID=930120 RepID=A0ABV8H3U9_9BACI